MLRAALETAQVPKYGTAADPAPRILGIRAAWIALAFVLAALLTLLALTQKRSRQTDLPRAPAPRLVPEPSPTGS